MSSGSQFGCPVDQCESSRPMWGPVVCVQWTHQHTTIVNTLKIDWTSPLLVGLDRCEHLDTQSTWHSGAALIYYTYIQHQTVPYQPYTIFHIPYAICHMPYTIYHAYLYIHTNMVVLCLTCKPYFPRLIDVINVITPFIDSITSLCDRFHDILCVYVNPHEVPLIVACSLLDALHWKPLKSTCAWCHNKYNMMIQIVFC